jgi:hypothetical protein
MLGASADHDILVLAPSSGRLCSLVKRPGGAVEGCSMSLLLSTSCTACCAGGDALGDHASVGTSASALEAFLDSAADPLAGGAGRGDYARQSVACQ